MCAEPTILVLCPVHSLVELVEILVAKHLVIKDVPLASGMFERVSIAFTGEIEPLRIGELPRPIKELLATDLGMTKFISLKVQIAFAAKTVGDQSTEIVK